MVRNKVDICIFCSEAPCVCNASNKSSPKKRGKSVPKSDKPDKPDSSDKSDNQDIPPVVSSAERKKLFAAAMKAEAAKAPPPPPPKPKVIHQHRAVDPDTALFEAAVRALGPLLAPDERERYRAILTSQPTLEEKRIVWKARRDGLGNSAEDSNQAG